MGPWAAALRASMGSPCSSAEASVCSLTSQLSWALILAQSPPCSAGAKTWEMTLTIKPGPEEALEVSPPASGLGVRKAEGRQYRELHVPKSPGLKQQQPFLTIQFSDALTHPSLLPVVPQLPKLLRESEFSFGPEFWLLCPDILTQTLTPTLPTLLWKAGLHTWASLSWTGHWHKQNLSKSREKISVLTARSYKSEYFPEMGIAKVLSSV